MLKSKVRVLGGVIVVALGAISLNACRLEDQDIELSVAAPAENSVRLCTDGVDNDQNGVKDCADPGCLEMGTAEVPGPGAVVCPHTVANGVVTLTENNLYTCSDGVDNDNNGFVDCGDNKCKATAACCPTPGQTETSEADCSDGIDNDCNGYTDCGDFSCWRRGVGTEYCRRLKCPNGAVTENTEELCKDGLDNDCNSYVDCNDNRCKQTQHCVRLLSKPEQSEIICDDSYDNDLNGLIDCDDPECKTNAHCSGVTKEPADRPANFASLSQAERAAILTLEKQLCSDSIDNDKNGRTDCQEYRCTLLSQIELQGAEAVYQIVCE